MIKYILGIIAGIIGAIALIIGRGRKIDYNPEDLPKKVELTQEETDEVIEASFETLEVEHEQDKEFENNVTKIKKEVHDLDDAEFADYVNLFFGVPAVNNPIVRTASESKFDWERTAGSDT